MTSRDTPLTPRRRATRSQPFVGFPTASTSNAQITPSSPIYTRPSIVEDLLEAETELVDAGDVQIGDLETRFHSSFTVRQAGKSTPKKSRNKAVTRTYGRSPRKSLSYVQVDEDEEEEVDDVTHKGQQPYRRDVYKVGDTICVDDRLVEPSVAVIIAIWTVLGDDITPVVHLKVHWFVRPSQLPGIRAKRAYYKNEVYYTLDATAVIPATPESRHCAIYTISDETAPSTSSLVDGLRAMDFDNSPYPLDRTFCCRFAINNVRGLYYAFLWKPHQDMALAVKSEHGSGDSWNVLPDDVVPKTPRKKRRLHRIREESEDDVDGAAGDENYRDEEVAVDSDDGDEGEPEDEEQDPDEAIPRTPSRKRKRAPSTPRRRRTKGTTLAAPTPHSKAALRARAKRKHLTIRPPPPDRSTDVSLHLESLPKDPWLRAMHVLHVASRPEALPCRDDEYQKVLRSVEELVEEGSGGCVYISGVPGTGKTATVHAVVRELKRMAEQNEGNPFTYVEINGLRIPEPSAAYGLLWEAVIGHDVVKEGHLKISSKEALKQLSRYFSSGGAGPSGHACVVLMDELDQLMTSKQDVVYNFFNWPTLVGSRLVVLAVANTMDLPERVMTGRVRSRLGMTRINFQPYTTPQLEQIVKARLASAREGLPSDSPNVIAPDGIKFASMKVSSISGDARRVLDICRRTVELVQPKAKTAGTEDVKQVIKDMQNSPTAAYLRDLSFHERLMLAAMLKCIKMEGVDEIKWGDLQRQHVNYVSLLSGNEDSLRRPTSGELSLVLEALVASRAMLCEEGAVVAKKGEDERRVVMNLEHAEVERVLGEVGGLKWKNALNI